MLTSPDHRLYVAFASGCGITPVIAMIRTLLTATPDARVVLFHGNRNAARTLLLEDLQALKDRYLSRFALHFVMSREPQEVELLNGRIDSQKVRALANRLFPLESVAKFYICGPGTMNQDVRDALAGLGVSRERIHAERYEALADAGQAGPTAHEATVAAATAPDTAPAQELAPEPADAPAATGDVTQVTVKIDGRRKTFTMHSREESVLDAAASAGLELPFSCKAGVCSTCRTKLVRGQVRLDQNYALEDWEIEEGFILACQAHPVTAEIEIDYDGG